MLIYLDVPGLLFKYPATFSPPFFKSCILVLKVPLVYLSSVTGFEDAVVTAEDSATAARALSVAAAQTAAMAGPGGGTTDSSGGLTRLTDSTDPGGGGGGGTNGTGPSRPNGKNHHYVSQPHLLDMPIQPPSSSRTQNNSVLNQLNNSPNPKPLVSPENYDPESDRVESSAEKETTF